MKIWSWFRAIWTNLILNLVFLTHWSMISTQYRLNLLSSSLELRWMLKVHGTLALSSILVSFVIQWVVVTCPEDISPSSVCIMKRIKLFGSWLASTLTTVMMLVKGFALIMYYIMIISIPFHFNYLRRDLRLWYIIIANRSRWRCIFKLVPYLTTTTLIYHLIWTIDLTWVICDLALSKRLI